MSAPRSTRQQLARVAALIILAFIAGLAVRGFISARPSTRSNNSTATTATPAASHATPGPNTVVDGIPAGFARTDDGARTAAISYVLTGQRLLEMEPTRVADAVRSMAAAGSADAQVTEAEQQLGALRTTLANGTGATHYFQAALASRVDAFTVDRARVSVWSVGVLSRAGIARPQQGTSSALVCSGPAGFASPGFASAGLASPGFAGAGFEGGNSSSHPIRRPSGVLTTITTS